MSTAESLADDLMDYQRVLLATARPPSNPTDAALSGLLCTPLLGVPMQSALDLCVARAMYGTFMCKTFSCSL